MAILCVVNNYGNMEYDWYGKAKLQPTVSETAAVKEKPENWFCDVGEINYDCSNIMALIKDFDKRLTRETFEEYQWVEYNIRREISSYGARWYYTIYAYGENAVHTAAQINCGYCYRSIYKEGRNIAHMEIVTENDVFIGYIENEKDLWDTIEWMEKVGFKGVVGVCIEDEFCNICEVGLCGIAVEDKSLEDIFYFNAAKEVAEKCTEFVCSIYKNLFPDRSREETYKEFLSFFVLRDFESAGNEIRSCVVIYETVNFGKVKNSCFENTTKELLEEISKLSEVK